MKTTCSVCYLIWGREKCNEREVLVVFLNRGLFKYYIITLGEGVGEGRGATQSITSDREGGGDNRLSFQHYTTFKKIKILEY